MRRFIGYGKELTFPEYVHDYIMHSDNGVTKEELAALLKKNGVDFQTKESKAELFEKVKKLLHTSEKIAEYFGISVDGEYYLGAFPFLTKATLKRLVKFEAIKVVGYKSFRAYGKTRFTPRYDLKQYLGMTESKMRRLIEKYPKGMRLPVDENDPAVLAKREKQRQQRQARKDEKARLEEEKARYVLSLEKELYALKCHGVQSAKEMLRLITAQTPCKPMSLGTICLDIETTGLSDTDEILQISIIDENGDTLMNEYLRPCIHTSWEDAQKINHISPELIEEKGRAPHELCGQIKSILESAKLIVGYNIYFDLRFLKDFFGVNVSGDKIYDVMPIFSEIYGDYSETHGNFKFKNLYECTCYFDYEWPGKAHDALEDAKATLFCYKEIENMSPETIEAIQERNERLMNGDPYPYSNL